ncbi:hypothetical protein, partial [Klebsiella variicola]|uniref:hypothetical protein n=1 Tax=Klebsiella variicola TaxID=244366 RepID=UPI002731EBAD
KKLKTLVDFTNPSGKQFKLTDPVNINPLERHDNELFTKVVEWMESSKPDQMEKIDVMTGWVSPKFFF